jgi:hypothetical protein
MQMNNGHTDLYSVWEAASLLGIRPEAVRSRLHRGTLEKYKEEDGTVYVRLTPEQLRKNNEQTDTQPLIAAHLDSLRSEIEYLRHQLEQANERDEQNRHLLAAMTSRLPQLPAPGDEPVSWWRRLFG